MILAFPFIFHRKTTISLYFTYKLLSYIMITLIMITIKNNPVLAEAFQNKEVREFFLDFLKDLYKGDNFKEFIKEGPSKIYIAQMNELSKSFKVILNGSDSYEVVERCLDGVEFKLGDSVEDVVSGSVYSIGRMYSDSQGLHVQLTHPLHPGYVTWRNLSQIELIPVVSQKKN